MLCFLGWHRYGGFKANRLGDEYSSLPVGLRSHVLQIRCIWCGRIMT